METTTIASHFSKIGPNDTILMVREGVPVSDALNRASLMLCCALAAMNERDSDDFTWCVAHMIETAKALIDAVPLAKFGVEQEVEA